MKTRKLIITLAAVMLVTFAAAPSANANPVIAAVILAAPFVAIFGLVAADIHQANADHQKIEAVADDPFRGSAIAANGEDWGED